MEGLLIGLLCISWVAWSRQKYLTVRAERRRQVANTAAQQWACLADQSGLFAARQRRRNG